jgi:hypothetical protein
VGYAGSVGRAAIDRESVLSFVGRDWRLARDRKREYWRARLERGGLREALRITEQLRDWMKLADPEWPAPEQREEDLETHCRVAEALSKTAPSAHVGRAGATRTRPRRVR